MGTASFNLPSPVVSIITESATPSPSVSTCQARRQLHHARRLHHLPVDHRMPMPAISTRQAGPRRWLRLWLGSLWRLTTSPRYDAVSLDWCSPCSRFFWMPLHSMETMTASQVERQQRHTRPDVPA